MYDADPETPPLEPGTRVRVVLSPDWNGPWPAQPLGVVGEPAPFLIVDPTSMSSSYVQRHWTRPIREYHITFDQPQYDGEGDGPYRAAVIWETYLRPLDPA